MLTSAHNHHQHHHHHHLQPSNGSTMPVAASPCSNSSSSLGGFHQGGSISSSTSDLLNSSNSSYGESSASSVRSTSHLQTMSTATTASEQQQSTTSVPRVRTIRLKRPSCALATAANVIHGQPQPQQQLQSRNLLIRGGTSMELAAGQVQATNPSNSLLFGFSIRGGSEYRTGFFVSHVEPGSEADLQGVQVGDQIIRVNNHPVDDATHKELSQYIANQSHLTLRVRNIGMIPVKDRDNDPLTWQMIHQDQKSSSSSDYDDVIQCRDILVTLSLGPKEKLGLGICKGPEWKSGIFVQFTKEQGIARRAGLKPGDQIISCNGVEFHDIFFNDAVAVMKSSSHLELIVRTAVGLELFPGESSGYNSSASSVTGGDQSPCWNESTTRRYDVEGKMNPTKFMKSPFKPKSSTGHRDRLMAVNTPKVPQLVSFQSVPQPMQQNVARPTRDVGGQNTTIIKLSGDGTIINNTLIPNGQENRGVSNGKRTLVRVMSMDDALDGCGRSSNVVVGRETEPRRVEVEVHRRDSLPRNASIPPPPPPMGKLNNQSDSAHVLSIGEEIRRRAERLQQQKVEQQCTIDERLQGKSKVGPHASSQHNQLMDEFKKAHQKMFQNGTRNVDEEVERQRAQQLRNNEVDRDLPDNVIQVPAATSAVAAAASVVSVAKSKSHFLANGKSSPSPPPPPPPESNALLISGDYDYSDVSPPPPIEFADGVVDNKTPTPSPQLLLTKPSPVDNNRRPNAATGASRKDPEKPATPTPDYDSLIYSSSAEDQQQPSKPVSQSKIPPPPPPLQKVNSAKPSNNTWGTAVRTPAKSAPPKPNRSISVTIGEYDSKKEPSKLGFLNKENGGAEKFNGNSTAGNASEMLKNELQMTLSRSNLRKTAEDKKNAMPNDSQNKPSKTVLEKTGNANVERLTSMLNARNQLFSNNTSNGGAAKINGNGGALAKTDTSSNKVTISIPKAKPANESEVKISPNGILKTGNGAVGISVGSSAATQPTTGSANSEVKNIKFDNITTVIGIRK